MTDGTSKAGSAAAPSDPPAESDSYARIGVYFTAEALRLQLYGGVSRYEIELVEALPAFGVSPVVSRWFSRSQILPVGAEFTGYALPRRSYDVRGVSRFSTTFGRRLEMAEIRRRRNHLVHHAYHGIPRRWSNPTVVTIHDMIYELYPELFDDAAVHIRSKAAAVEESDLVIADSESTKRDLVRLLGTAPEKISVVHLAPGSSCTSPRSYDALDSTVVGRQFLLFVGSRKGYKQFVRALDVLRMITERDVKLVAFGGGSPSDEERALISRYALTDRVVFAGGDDHELARHYLGASALLYTSEYEGFGLPLLEAMGYGCPVLCGTNSSLPEVGGDAARYVDWTNPEATAASVAEILGDATTRASLVKAGVTRAEAFSWAKTAQATREVYAKLASAARSSPSVLCRKRCE